MRNVPIVNVYLLPLGLDVPPVNVSAYILGLQYTDSDHKADKLVLTVDNDDLSNFDEPLWRDGNGLIVSWGYPEALTVERTVTIKRVVGFRELKVEAFGGELALDRIKRNRPFENLTCSEIARQIANEWGYVEERVLHIEPSSVRYEHTHQPAITDADLLRRLQAKTGFRWFINHDGFHFHRPEFLQQTEKRLRFGGNQNIAEILDIHLDVDVTRIGDVQVSAYVFRENHGLKIQVRKETDAEKQILAKHEEVAGITDLGVPGQNMPADAPLPPFGLLPSTPAPPSLVVHPSLGTRAYFDMRRTNETDIEAIKANAEAARAKAMRGAVKMKVTIVGDPNVYAGTIVEIDGIGKRLSQRYYVENVDHRIGSGGYTTELECFSDGSAGHSTKSKFLSEAIIIQMAPRAVGVRRSPEDNTPHPGIKFPIDPHLETPSTPALPDAPAPVPDPESDQLEMGNIDLRNRPYHKNEDGSYSTISSISVTFSDTVFGKRTDMTYVLPTIADDGRKLTNDEAVQYFKDTGKHLGIFKTISAAEAESERLHLDQERHPPNNTLGPIPADAEGPATPDLTTSGPISSN